MARPRFCGSCGTQTAGPTQAFCGSCGSALPPDTVGRFQVIEVLGNSGSGTVFLCRDPDLGRLVALRRLSPALANDSTRMARLRQAASRLAGVHDPNCVLLLDFLDTETPPILVNEYIDGPSLAAVGRE